MTTGPIGRSSPMASAGGHRGGVPRPGVTAPPGTARVGAMTDGYWDSPWPGEDAGPSRRQAPHGVAGWGLVPGATLDVVARHDLLAATMPIVRDPGELFLLRHTIGADTVSWVERIDPSTLATVGRSRGPRGRAVLARRDGGPRGRRTDRRLRPVGAPARSGPGGGRLARATGRPRVQLVRRPGRRHGRHQGPVRGDRSRRLSRCSTR